MSSFHCCACPSHPGCYSPPRNGIIHSQWYPTRTTDRGSPTRPKSSRRISPKTPRSRCPAYLQFTSPKANGRKASSVQWESNRQFNWTGPTTRVVDLRPQRRSRRHIRTRGLIQPQQRRRWTSSVLPILEDDDDIITVEASAPVTQKRKHNQLAWGYCDETVLVEVVVRATMLCSVPIYISECFIYPIIFSHQLCTKPNPKSIPLVRFENLSYPTPNHHSSTHPPLSHAFPYIYRNTVPG